MKTFKIGDKVKILSYNNFETIIESIEGDLYWSKDEEGKLKVCTAEEMELVSEYNETFNPEAHSSLIIDFDKHELLLTESIESNKVETIEKAAKNAWGNVHRSGVLGFIEGAKSDAARNHWFKIFQEEQKPNVQLIDSKQLNK